MKPLVVLPDCIRLLRNALLTVPEVDALIDGRITTRLPDTPVYPCVTLQRTGGIPVDRHRVDRALIDINVWGGPLTGDVEPATHQIARVVRAAVHALEGYQDIHGVITGVEDVLTGQWLPDTVPTPPVARVVLFVGIYAHP